VTNEAASSRVSAYYWGRVTDFLAADAGSLLGILTASHSFDLDQRQRDAWEEEILILKSALAGLSGTVFLEFDIPRLGSRIDAVLVCGPAIFPIEFKCGEDRFNLGDYNQAWDYALDLKNFHKASHSAPIFPLLVATASTRSDKDWQPTHADGVRPPFRCGSGHARRAIDSALGVAAGEPIDGAAWGSAPYQPTPTIIEAARALYARHTVDAISRNDAGAKNLTVTSGAVEQIIEHARAAQQKAIVFVTGVPGAGKTLVGLNVATKRRELGEARAVFLSGNGPLVAVLQEALVRDEMARLGGGVRKGDIRQKVKPFIQNVHHFRDDGIRNPAAPGDHVVIFDEAQRAWDRVKAADFMKRRKKIPDFNQSEPEFLISYLDRHEQWAVIVCLVGGGQEIHSGEAGIGEWFNAVRSGFEHWQVHVSPSLGDSEFAFGSATGTFARSPRFVEDERLHLSASMRSFRSEQVSAFVKAVLDCETDGARHLLEEISRRYPIAITRDLTVAKRWIRNHARGSERFGLVASSKAQRLKPHAIDVRVDVDPIHWFLDGRHDTRSSYYLEDAATEFQIQGLELDWICVTWDADLRRDSDGWRYHEFRGKNWNAISNKGNRRRYLLNAYRVLLTRARQGMVIFVPPGDDTDPTRKPAFYDQTYEYLSGLGLPEA
jgi:hypothetical protein